MKNTTETAETAPQKFFAALAKMGFRPARWDAANGMRLLDLCNADGHTEYRVAYEPDRDRPTLYHFDGKRSQILIWEMTLSPNMPLDTILAVIDTAIPAELKKTVRHGNRRVAIPA